MITIFKWRVRRILNRIRSQQDECANSIKSILKVWINNNKYLFFIKS